VRQIVEVALGALALVLTLASVVMMERNRGIQQEVAERQQLIAKAQTFATINNSLIQLLARTAAGSKDQALSDLLSRNGITFSLSPAAATAPAPAASAATPAP